MTERQGPVWGILLAAGSGRRFGSGKQFTEVRGQRLVDLALRATSRACDAVVLVLPPGVAWDGAPVARVVAGGPSRTASVRAGLGEVPPDAAIVVVHQAANPLATQALFDAVLEAVWGGADAAVPGLTPADVVRRVEGSRMLEDVGRDDLVIVQTPGAFRAEILRAAHASGAEAVEDTALVAALGVTVTVVEGDPRNVHVATPTDLSIVGALLEGAVAEARHGC